MKGFITFSFCFLSLVSYCIPFPINFGSLKISKPTDTSKLILKEKIETKIDLNNIEFKTKTHFKYAQILDLPVENIDNLLLFDFITTWYKTKYLFGGTSMKGIDCSAFTLMLMKEVYCIDLTRTVTSQYKQCQPINKQELIQGDLIFFHTTRRGLSHVGVYIGQNKFVHASSSEGVTINDLNMPYYVKAYRAAGRIVTK